MKSQCLPFLFAQILFILVLYGSCQHLENDLHSLLHDTDVNYKNPRPTSSDDDFEVEFFDPPANLKEKNDIIYDGVVKRLWGVPDTTADAGKIFFYLMPNDVFKGKVSYYEFPELPSWLLWDKRQGALRGVPLKKDIGYHYIDVDAMVNGFSESRARERFAIQVVPVHDSRMIEDTKCKSDKIALLTIVGARDVVKMSAHQRIKSIEKLSNRFSLHSSKMTLSVVPISSSDPLSDDSALVAGPGDSQLSDLPQGGTADLMQLSWPVGCDDSVHKDWQKTVDDVEVMAKSGALKRLMGAPVIGWHVTSVSAFTNRVKRQADDYEYSGDDEYDYSDYDDHFKKPDVRVIPSLASPVFPESPATSDEFAMRGGYVSPILRIVPISTAVYIPVKPTPVVEPSPTVIDGHSTAPDLYYGGSMGELDSSLLTHPTSTVGHTTPLSKISTMTSSPTRFRPPIEPTSVPDFGPITEYDIKNFSPQIGQRLPKLAWNAGSLYRMRIPADAFTDTEDGGTRNLSIILRDENGQVFGKDSWIQFEPTKQEIYALPVEKKIGKYEFVLEAIDRGRKSVTDILKISVRQPKKARNFNHEFTAVFKLEKKHEYEFNYALDWQVKAVEKIAAYFGDANTDHINVRSIATDPVNIVWTNSSLADSESNVCLFQELIDISLKLSKGFGTEPTREIKEAFSPEFRLKKIHLHYNPPCLDIKLRWKYNGGSNDVRGMGRVGGISIPEGSEEEGDRATGISHVNGKPTFRNQIDKLNATAGMMLKWMVPEDTCYDFEDGNTKNMAMRLITTDLNYPPLTSWLQFDEANQEFFGLPLLADVGKQSYILECIDGANAKVSDALVVIVKPFPHMTQPPVKFTITINMNYDSLMSSADTQVRLVEDISKAFGDTDARHVYVESLKEGSVVVTWQNISLKGDECPTEDINRLRRIMIDEKGVLRKDFKATFKNFDVTEGMMIPYGHCIAGDSPTYDDNDDLETPEEKQISSSESDYLLTFIIPAVIIAIMLILAALIACCLYRRRRYGKMSMVDDRTFVSKGIPIIFAEELDDHRPDNAKSPVIMKEEKPPLPPPEYQKNSPPVGYAGMTPPRMDRHRNASSEASNSADDTPYQPPPPFTSSSNGASRNPRPNLPPAYRKPPTYVPP